MEQDAASPRIRSRPNVIWKLNAQFAWQFASLSEHYRPARGVKCRACKRIIKVEPQIPVVEWDEGSDQIGDFVAGGGIHPVLRVEVADRLIERFQGIAKGPIKMYDHPNLRRPKRVTKRTKRCVWLPYEGPPLCELVVTQIVNLDPKSTVLLEAECAVCGSRVYNRFVGVEEQAGLDHTPRVSGQGLFIRHSEIQGCDFFRPRDTGLTLCTDAVRKFITKAGYTNVRFFEYGTLLK